MSDNFDHDSYHPFEVLNSPQGRPITDPDLRDSILAQITRNDFKYEESLTLEQQLQQRGESLLGGAVVATPEQAAWIDEAAKNATPEERNKFTLQPLPGAGDAANLEATTKDPAQSPGLESHQDALDRTRAQTNDADGSGSTVDSVAKTQAAREKPNSLESSLANVRLSTERQQRVVIVGDEHVRRKFYEILASKNQVFYQGGSAIITANDKQIANYLKQAAAEVSKTTPGTNVVHALQMEMNRDSAGLYGGAKAAIANIFGKKHEITVFAAGTPEKLAEKLGEVDKFVKTLQEAKLVPEGDAKRVVSQLAINKDDPQHRPVELKNLSGLRDVVKDAIDKVAYYNAEQRDKETARREFRSEKDDKSMADSKAKEKDAAEGGGSASASAPHKRTAELAESFDKHFGSPAMLVSDTGQQQSYAQKLSFQMAKIADPVNAELSTLPDADRQKFIVQMAAVVEKIADKEVDNVKSPTSRKLPSQELDVARKDGTPAARERLTDFVKLELARDDKFAEKVPDLLKAMVDNKAITSDQATRIADRVAELARELPAATKSEAPAEAAATSKETSLATPEASAQAPVQPPDKSTAEPAIKDAAPSPDTVTSTASASPEVKSDTPAADVAQAATQATDKVIGAEPAAALDKGESAPTDKPGLSADTTVSTVKAPATELETKLADIASMDPSKVSPDKAMSVIAELDAKQSAPLSALGLGNTETTTKSLARVEGLLEKAEAGTFGAEASAYAGTLKDALDRWKEQDLLQSMSSGVSPYKHADKIDEAKASEPKWHDQGASLVATQAPAPAPDVKLDSAAPVATEKAPAPTPESTPVAQKEVPAAPPVDSAKEAERAESVMRLAKTEVAAGMLAGMLESPANRLTNRDKSWNEEAVGQMVDKVFAMDPESVSKLSPGAAQRAVSASVFLALSAREGKLPGFDGPDGAEKSERLANQVASLAEKLPNALAYNLDVGKQVEKAEQFIDRMAERQKELQLSSTQTREPQPLREESASSSDKTRATHELAKDLVHVAYRGGRPTDPQVKSLLKSANKLTPQTLKGLDPATKAKTATALKVLVANVRNHDLLGDYSKLSDGMKQIVAGAQKASDQLTSGLSKDPAMKIELLKAHQELPGREASSGKSMEPSTSKQMDGATQSPAKAVKAGPSMER